MNVMTWADDAVLRSLFVERLPDAVMRRPHVFFNPALLRAAFVPAGLCGPSASDDLVAALYLDRPSCRLASPNPFFDETWYLVRNPDVASEVARGHLLSGFHHFINYGLDEGRWPNEELENSATSIRESASVEALDEDAYLALNEAARDFLHAFPWYEPLRHYNVYGRRLGYRTIDPAHPGDTSADDPVAAEFDAEFYRSAYMADLRPTRPAYEHYCSVGVGRGFNPNRWFDEGWYRAFYPDVRDAIAAKTMPSGFHHFIAFGRTEGRHPAYDLTHALEAKLPGVTEPYLLRRIDGLKRKLGMFDPTPSRVDAAGETVRIWFILPFLNPDIAFGGYQTAFALMVELHRAGFLLGIYCMEEERPNLDYFLWRQSSPAIRAAFETCLVVGTDGSGTLPVRRCDRVVTYSIWGLTLAANLSSLSGARLPYLLAQEYEPIFYENDTLRVLCERFYDIGHVPIVNSAFLLRYFRDRRIGPFADDPGRDDGFASFEPRINRIGLQTPERMAARTERTLLVYARPEGHAGRNLFELVVLALEQLCLDGAFGAEWSFVGLGALSDLPDVPLGPHHALRLVKKMEEAEYTAAVEASDIGISLMCAPHPSIVPFELATAGGLVVTNIYENRSADDLRAVCANIVPCTMSLDGVVRALREAIARVNDFEARHAAAYRPTATSWAEIFTPAFLRRTFGLPTVPDLPAAGRDALTPERWARWRPDTTRAD